MTSKKRQEYMKKYYQEHKEEMKEQARNWCKANYARHKELNMISKKRLNYAWEKTSKQRYLRNIKRKTRILFPLINKKCKLCGKNATEHHYTKPIEVNKFWFVCHNCHITKSRRKKNE